MPEATAARTVDRARAANAALAAAAVLLAAIGYYLRFGYSFGADDHDDLLPELLHRLDPGLFGRDPFVNDRVAGVSPRGGFVLLLLLLGRVVGVPAAVGLVYVVAFAGTAAGVHRLARVMLPDLPLAALAAPAAAIVAFALWPLGQNTLVYPYLVPEGIAWALAIPAMAGLARGRVVLPAVLVGLAAWVHGVTGLILAPALALTIALVPGDLASALRRAGLFIAVFAAVAAPFVVPLVFGQLGEQAGLAPTGYDLFVRLRLPHHLLPTAFPAASWLRFIALAAGGGASLWWLARADLLRDRSFGVRFLLVTAVACTVAFAGVVALESLSIARAQAFKLTVPAAAVLAVAICGSAAAAVARAPAGVKRMLELPVTHPVWTFAATGVAAVIVVVLAATGVGRPGALYGPRAHRQSDAGRVERWARRETDADALFVVPPGNTSFRVGAQRSVVVTWKAHPFRADAMRAWLDDLQAVAPAPVDWAAAGWNHRARVDSAYCANEAGDWRAISEWTEADYAVVETGCGAPPYPPVYRAGRLSVHPLAP